MTNNKYFVITLCLAVILMAESVWAVDYLSVTRKQEVQQQMPGPKLSLSYLEEEVPLVGENLTATITVKPEKKAIQALDAIVYFEKDKLELMQIVPLINAPGAEYPQMKIFEGEGKLAVSLVLFEEPISSPSAIAEIIFKAKQPGVARAWFKFDYGKTTDSNVVLFNDVSDSLVGVENLELVVASSQ